MGCTDHLQTIMTPLAYLDDGSCTYDVTALTLDMSDSYSDGWDGASFTITDTNGYVYLDATILTGGSGTATVCLPDAVCFTLTCGGGSYASEHSWTLTDDASSLTVASGGDSI